MRFKLWWWLLPAILFAFFLGARLLDADPLWNDEFYQYRDARVSNDLFLIADHLAIQNPWHAPGYFILLNLWARIGGWHPFLLRSVALFMGMLALAWTYRLGRDHISPRVGLYAALILATSEFFDHYLGETRMYTFTVMLTALLLWLYLRIVRKQGEPTTRDWLALFLVTLVSLYSHYFMLLPLGAIAFYHLLFVSKNRRWWLVTGVMLLAGVLFLPWVFGALFKAITRATGRNLVGLMTGPQTVEFVAYLFANGFTVLLIVCLLLALWAAWQSRGQARSGLIAILVMTAVIAAQIVIVGTVVRVFVDERSRYLIFVWPPLAVLAGAGIAHLAYRWQGNLGRALTVLVLGGWLLLGIRNNLLPTLTADLPGSTLTFPLHLVMRDLHSLHRPGDYIVSVAPDSNNYERYNNVTPIYIEVERLAANSRPIGVVREGDQQELYQSVIGAIGAGREYVWVAYRTDPVPSTLAPFTDMLDDTYAMCGIADTRADYALRIDEYARSPVCCTPNVQPRDPLIDYGNGLTLMGIDLQPEGSQIRVFASWSGGNTLPPETYSIALHIVDETGSMVTQADYGLPVETFLCPQHLLDVTALPPGDYQVMAIVYNWQNGARLNGTNPQTGQQADSLPVAAFTIAPDGTIQINT